MLAGASDILPNEICERLWAEAANTATDLDGILVGPGETVDSTTNSLGRDTKAISFFRQRFLVKSAS